MNSKKAKKFAPVKPYDQTLEDHWAMYDNMPYERDNDICNDRNIAMESGNVIKSYRCLFKEPFEIKISQESF